MKHSCSSMAMGSIGMAMGEVEIPSPDNTLSMMTGSGHFGPIEMGGVFTLMKIRKGLTRDDYRDPGPYQFPRGAVAYESMRPPAKLHIRSTANRPSATK